MAILKDMECDGHERVVSCRDDSVGLRAIIAIHSTVLGPALGGVRMWPYASSKEALRDVLRLAQAMTYKAAVAGLPLGGGKAVIIGDPQRKKTEGLLRAFGRAVEGLKGRYLTAEDVGMTVADMEIVRKETKHVTGTSEKKGGSGDPSYPTAKGMLYAPDYVVNAGGIMNILVGLQGGRKGYDRAKAERLLRQIPDTLHAIFSKARAEGLTTAQAADALAEARLQEASAQKMDAGARRAVTLRGRTGRTRVRR